MNIDYKFDFTKNFYRANFMENSQGEEFIRYYKYDTVKEDGDYLICGFNNGYTERVPKGAFDITEKGNYIN